MKKLLSALTAGLFILGCNQAAEALDVDFEHDVTATSHGVLLVSIKMVMSFLLVLLV